MTSKDIMYSKGKNDECYTPPYTVEPIIKYIEQYMLRNAKDLNYNLTVWCPFDTKESEFVKQISKIPYTTVVHSHIDEDKDFFEYEPDEWDIIISNPPFSAKAKTFERALSFGKPFALLMNITWLNDKTPKKLFGNDMQLLLLDSRSLFIFPDGSINDKITFSSAYFGYKFFQQGIQVASIPTISKQKKLLKKNIE
jgi:hypothetical protein